MDEWETADVLSAFGRQAVPAILHSMRKDTKNWKHGCRALGKIGPEAEEAIPLLVAIVRYEGSEESALKAVDDACTALAEIGPAASGAMIRVLEDPEVAGVRGREVLFPGFGRGVEILRESSYECVRHYFRSLGMEGRKHIDDFISFLKTGTSAQRETAAYCIGYLGSEAGSALPALIEILNHPNPRVRISSLDTLAAFGSPALKALPEVYRRLEDADDGVAAQALKTCCLLETDVPSQLSVLKTALDGDCRKVHSEAFEVVRRLAKKAKPLAPIIMERIVEMGDLGTRSRTDERNGNLLSAIRALRATRTDDPDVIEALAVSAARNRWFEKSREEGQGITVIGGTRDEAGQQVIIFFEELENKESAARAVPVLGSCITSDPAQRTWALSILRHLGPLAAPCSDAILRYFTAEKHRRPIAIAGDTCEDDSEWERRSELTREVLAACGRRALPGLAGIHEKGSEEIRYAVLDTLLLMDGGEIASSPEAIEILMKALKDPHEPTAAEAAIALARAGPSAREAVPSLLEGTGRVDYMKVQRARERQGGEVGPPVFSVAVAAHAALYRITGDFEPNFGKALALARTRLQQGGGDDYRWRLIQALSMFGKKAVPELLRCIEEEGKDLRCNIIDVLAEIGPAAKEALPRVMRIMKESLKKGDGAFHHCFSFLWKIGPEARKAVPDFAAILDTGKPNEMFCLCCARLLGRIGEPSPEVLLVLDRLSRIDSSEVREAARDALSLLKCE